MKTLEKPLPTDPGRDVRRAWWSLLLYLPSLVLAFVVGEGLVAVYGYGDGQDAPGWVMAAAGIPACLVFALPLLVTVPLSRRAARSGRSDAWWPTMVAGGVVAAFLVQNLLALAASLIAG